jgi:putative aldouronate transport system substrate-binding protein
MPESDLNAMATWQKDNDAAYIVPGTLSMTADEATEYTNIMIDLETYRSEMVVNFILGVEPIENYDAFVEYFKSKNIDRAIEIKQASFDRYQAR